MMGNTITHHGEATLSQEPKVIWHLGRRRIALAGAVLATTVCVVLCSSWRVIPLLFGDGVLVYLACWPGQRNPSAISVAAADTDQQAEAEDAHTPAEDVRCREHLCKLADAVGSQLVHLLAPVSVGAQHMRDLADTVAAIAERSGENIVSSRMAADDSVEASRTLSMATTELENSITNIANQMLHATELSGAAVAAGADARTTMGQLTGQVRSVGNVTGRIAGLARQTNLLALNATIEAARAGNAGSGFAVVAGEVKLLARQTATLTDEIAQLIAAVERVSLDAVGKVNFMEQRIIQIEAIAGRIAGEIEEQRRATANIADNVQQTAAASTTLSSQLENLTVTMMESLDQTAAIHVAANSLVIDADQIDNNLRRCLTEAIVLISRSECNDTAASMEGRRGEGAAPG